MCWNWDVKNIDYPHLFQAGMLMCNNLSLDLSMAATNHHPVLVCHTPPLAYTNFSLPTISPHQHTTQFLNNLTGSASTLNPLCISQNLQPLSPAYSCTLSTSLPDVPHLPSSLECAKHPAVVPPLARSCIERPGSVASTQTLGSLTLPRKDSEGSAAPLALPSPVAPMVEPLKRGEPRKGPPCCYSNFPQNSPLADVRKPAPTPQGLPHCPRHPIIHA
jgi:hypothetical protein